MPTKGFSESVNQHNCDLEPFTDWVEGSVLFLGEDVTRSDLVDRLLEGNIYRNQEFAHRWLDTVFGELRRRLALISPNPPIIIEGSRVKRVENWDRHPAYAFCMGLSLQIHYREAVKGAFGIDYHVQGRLFEKLIAESLHANDWSVESVGWSHETAHSVAEQVQGLASALGEDQRPGAVERWTEPKAKDSGLDLVAWQSFPDGWSGRPVCLVQCASGEDWHDKLATPDLRIWGQLISFTTEPRRGLAMPFAPEAEVFRRRAGRDGVMLLLDRHRVMHTKGKIPYPSPKLATDLNQWTANRIDCFPRE